MTSKNLFFKLIKQDVQKRIWCPILIFIGCFLAFEVRMLMMFDNLTERGKITLKEYVEQRFFGTETRLIAVLVCCAALLCALSGFAYLHSRKQLDTYHSLPINRTQLFFSKYISGVMQFFLPFLFHIFVCMGIAAGKSAFSSVAFVNAMQVICVWTLVFLLAYGVFIMAVCLTGNLIVSIVGSVVLFLYSALVNLLYYAMLERFFHTFVIVREEGIFGGVCGFSPLSLFIRLFVPNESVDVQIGYFKYNADYIWVIVLAAIVYTLIAYVLHWKRPSEAAGKAIAYRPAEPVIKTLLVIPGAFYSADFFAQVASSSKNDNAWYLFGVVFGYLVIALLIEIIFRFDIKSAFCHWKQLLFNAACVAIIFVIFRYDALGYDTYVPADTELTSCAVSIDNLMAVSPLESMDLYSIIYTDTTAYRMENVTIQGNPNVMELARKAVADGYRIEEMREGNPEWEYHPITFGYNLKNGKSVYRRYYINIADAEIMKLLSDVYNDEGYKTGTNPMLNSGWEEEYKYLYCVGNMCSETLDVTPKFQSELIETYREEYLQLDFDTVLNTYPVGCIVPETVQEYEYVSKSPSFSNYEAFGIYNAQYNGCLIYPQFTKTIALLAENGFDIYETFSSDEIDHILITYIDRREVYVDTHNSYTTQKYIEIADIFDDEQKQQILDSVLNTSLNWQVSEYTDFLDEHFEVNIYIDTKDKAIIKKYQFQKDMVPQFIYELEEYKKAIAQ